MYVVCSFGFRLRCIEFPIPCADRIEPLSASLPTVRSPLVCGHLFCLPTSYPPSTSLCSHYHFYLVHYFLSHQLSHQPLHHHHHCSGDLPLPLRARGKAGMGGFFLCFFFLFYCDIIFIFLNDSNLKY